MSEDPLLRLWSWSVTKIGRRTMLTFGLLLVILGSVLLGLSNVLLRLDETGLFLFMLIGLSFSWQLARSSLAGWASALLGGASGVGLIFFLFGNLGGPVVNFLQAAGRLISPGWLWEIDLTDSLAALGEIWAIVRVLLLRLFEWTRSLFSGAGAYDPVAADMVWSLMFWFLAFWAGWCVRRWRQPLVGVVPAGLVLATSLNFARGSPSALLFLLGGTLLLLAVTNLDQRELGWEKERIDFSEEIRFDFYLVSLSVTLALVTASILVPPISVQKAFDLVQRLGQGAAGESSPAAEALGIRRRPAPDRPLLNLYAPGLPRRHLLGSGPELSQQVALYVQTGDLPPGSPEMIQSRPVPRYYWRSLTFNSYTGHGWITAPLEIVEYRAGEPAQADIPQGYRMVEQRVERLVEDSREEQILYATGELVSADRDFRVLRRSVRLGRDERGGGDSLTADIFGATITAEEYQAVSLVPVVSEDRLRGAAGKVPAWVHRRYLPLPDSIPSRVFSLARSLTAAQPTPYDRAKAIEAYLRSYPYTLDLPAPPDEQDVVDYFLFDLKKGYCDYFASAMVVLARAAGLPARLVMGYATGQYDPLNARYIVTEADAHSWPEIYFAGIGWVEFEPTAGQPALLRADTAAREEVPELLPGQETSAVDVFQTPTPPNWPVLFKWAGIFLALVAVLLIAGLFADNWRLHSLSPATAVTRLYRRIYRQGKRLNVPSRPGDTPHEFSGVFTNRIVELARGKRWESLLHPSRMEVQKLTDLYTRAIYSPAPLSETDHRQALQTWERLRWRLWLMRLLWKGGKMRDEG